jgi:NADH-quinone oxidoreductase subunit B
VAAVDLPPPRRGSAAGLPVVVDAGRGCVLWVFDAGLACCAVEVAAALSRAGAGAFAGAFAGAGGSAGPAGVNVFVVAGTVTDKLAPLVLAAYEQVPEPRFVLSFGACSNSGGPYWDSYCVTKGVDQFIPVDVYVPGCPPRPEALLAGLDVLLQRDVR